MKLACEKSNGWNVHVGQLEPMGIRLLPTQGSGTTAVSAASGTVISFPFAKPQQP